MSDPYFSSAKKMDKEPAVIKQGGDPQLVENAIYVNGCTVGYGNADVFVKLVRNGEHMLTLNMSYTFAKTLSQLLGTTIQDLESKAGMDIRTTFQLDEAMKPTADKQ